MAPAERWIAGLGVGEKVQLAGQSTHHHEIGPARWTGGGRGGPRQQAFDSRQALHDVVEQALLRIHASPEKVADPVIGRLIDKITVDPNPAPYPDRFPHHHGATVTITLKDGRQFSAHVDFPRGSAPRGIEWADVDAKYRRLVPLSGLAPEKVEASLRVVHEFETVKTMSELTRLLS